MKPKQIFLHDSSNLDNHHFIGVQKSAHISHMFARADPTAQVYIRPSLDELRSALTLLLVHRGISGVRRPGYRRGGAT